MGRAAEELQRRQQASAPPQGGFAGRAAAELQRRGLPPRPDPTLSQRVFRGVGGTIGTMAGTPLGLGGMVAGGAAGAMIASDLESWLASQPEIVAPPKEPVPLIPDSANPLDWLPPSSIARLLGAILSDEQVPGTQRTQEEIRNDLDDAALEGGVGGVVARVLQPVARGGEALLRSTARARRTIPEAATTRAEDLANPLRVPDPRSALAKVMSEYGKVAAGTGALGGGAGVLAEGLVPGSGALSGLVSAGTAATVGILMRMPALSRTLLADNPRFAAWALSTAPSAVTTGTAAAGGQTAVQGTEGAADAGSRAGNFVMDEAGRITGLTVEATNDLVDMMASEGPEFAAAARQFMRELMTSQQQER